MTVVGKRVLVAGFLTLTVTLLATGCGNSAKSTGGADSSASPSAAGATKPGDKTPIRIGAVFDTTGGSAQFGTPQYNGAQLFVKQLNANGGIGGRQVELINIDSESQETKAVLAVRRLIDQEKVVAVVGGSSSGASLAMIDYIEKKGVPFLSVGSSARITDPVKKWVFKTPQSERLAMEKLFDYLNANKLTKIGWASVNNAFGDSGREEFEKLLPKFGMTNVGNERFNANDTDLTPQVSSLKGKAPESVVVWTNPPSGSVLVKNYRQLGVKGPLLLSHGMVSQSLFDQAGADAEGVILPGSKLLVAGELPDSDPQKALLTKFAADYQEAFKEKAIPFAGYGYDTMLLLAKAIEQAGTEPAAIRDALEGKIEKVVGTTGVFTFTPQDHNGLDKDSLVLVEVKNGAWSLYRQP